MRPAVRLATVALGVSFGLAGATLAQDRIPSDCIALASANPSVVPVRFGDQLGLDQVLIRYLDHAEFAIATSSVMAVTDYNGSFTTADQVPNVVTMNNAHGTHFTDSPDPRIPLVLRGWPVDGVPAAHDLDLGDMRIRNVTTDLRGPFGEGARRDGNSIFIFEAAGLCIGHLGHLHQIPSPAQYAVIGRLDVVMVPVDGGYTMDVAVMADVIRRFNPRIVLPMHWFTPEGLSRFLVELNRDYEITVSDTPELMVTRATLPQKPTVVVLQPAPLP
ncbi:MAG: MBL fold metallo-hydrolase [Candidatus Saccharibacteria bacterium]|nr:MBL fold metallo-hydrolase [Pseudorhodobacter sp.]